MKATRPNHPATDPLLDRLDTFHKGSRLLGRLLEDQGVRIELMSDVAKEHGAQRHKRAPLGKGSNDGFIGLGLSAHHCALYSHDGNRAFGARGDLMIPKVRQVIPGCDYVVVINLSNPSGLAIADGAAGLPVEPVPPAFVDAYRNDEVRAANLHDVLRVLDHVIIARLSALADRAGQ